jgi:starch synthase
MSKTLKVLFLSAEADPFVKIGGLGDVARSLPLAIRSIPPEDNGGYKMDVRLAIPLHTVVRRVASTLRRVSVFSLQCSGADIPVQVFETNMKDMPVYLVAGDPINSSGAVYSSNPTLDGEKYTFFSLASLNFLKQTSWQPDIIHANDWHTALAIYILLIKRWSGEYPGTAAILTVHNLPFLGPDVTEHLADYGLPLATTDLPEWARALPLPLGLWAADAIVAVSPTYAHEILTPDNGAGLHGFINRRADVLSGILNGIDVQAYDPETDNALISNFNVNSLNKRGKNKIALQERLGFSPDPGTPLLGMVSRMDPQKGVDLAIDALKKIKNLPWQGIILGTGDPVLEAEALHLQSDLPARFRVEVRFDPRLARQIYAGADILLMPSRYEPCGLSQLIALRYGCIPIVRSTGGLKDTIRHGETGFLFENATPKALTNALREAFLLYKDQERWQILQRNCMSQDFSWFHSAKQYAALYRSLVQVHHLL